MRDSLLWIIASKIIIELYRVCDENQNLFNVYHIVKTYKYL